MEDQYRLSTNVVFGDILGDKLKIKCSWILLHIMNGDEDSTVIFHEHSADSPLPPSQHKNM